MKKIAFWLWMLTKRLYKMPAFLAILLLIPIFSVSYRVATQDSGGMMTIALAQEAEDPVSDAIIEDLQDTSKVFSYRSCQSVEEAQLLVSTGKVDAAWIFPADMEERMADFMANPSQDTAIVQVIQREDNVAHMLTRERLSGTVFHQLSRRFYLQYVRENVPELADLSDEALMAYYDDFEMDGTLFAFETDGGKPADDTHYLLSPIRGILAILAVLCGMAAAMYYLRDRKNGTFAWVPQRMQPVPELGSQAVAVGNVVAVSLVTLLLTGLAGNLFLELAVLILYTLCVAAFCMLLRSVLNSARAIGALMPLLAVVMLLVCPVFVSLAKLRLLQFLLPPTYYMNAVQDPRYLLYMPLYTAVCGGLYLLSEKLHKRI